VVAELITAGANVNISGVNGETALYIAAEEGFVEIARLLLAAGACVNPVGDDSVSLWAACGHGHLDIVNMFLDAKAYIHISEVRGCSSICFASTGGYTEIVQTLLAAGCDANESLDSGETVRVIH
jgi:ankyrin repeat protein